MPFFFKLTEITQSIRKKLWFVSIIFPAQTWSHSLQSKIPKLSKVKSIRKFKVEPEEVLATTKNNYCYY